jgi:MFS family permease
LNSQEAVAMPQEQGTSHWWPTFGIMLGGLTVALNSGVLNVAIPSMMSSLSTDLDRIQWVQTSFQIIQAVMIPAVGWLGARVGTKRLFILSTLLFIIGSALCGLAWNVQSLILFRTLQGIGGGPITPLSMSILYSTSPPTNVASPWACRTSPSPSGRPSRRRSVVISSRSSVGGRFFT